MNEGCEMELALTPAARQAAKAIGKVLVIGTVTAGTGLAGIRGVQGVSRWMSSGKREPPPPLRAQAIPIRTQELQNHDVSPVAPFKREETRQQGIPREVPMIIPPS